MILYGENPSLSHVPNAQRSIPAQIIAGIPLVQNNSDYWLLERLHKYSSKGVERAVHPEVTIRHTTKVLKKIGVTTISEVTRLDNVGIPNFMSVRPRDNRFGISYYNGKGVTIKDAHAGAIMEAVERHAGETCSYPTIAATYAEMMRCCTVVHPKTIVAPELQEFSEDLILEWVAGFDLIQNRETWVPLNAVVCPYDSSSYPHLIPANSNGLASGNFRTEALCQAICEVIERDSQAMAMTKLRILPVLSSTLGADLNSSGHEPLRRVISHEGLPLRAARLVGKLKRAGLTVLLHDLTSPVGVATVECTLLDDRRSGGVQRFGGLGTHPDARIAVTRSITEAAQSRISLIQGGREDIPRILQNADQEKSQTRSSSRLKNERLLITYQDLPTVENTFIDDDVRFLLEQLAKSDLKQVIVFDLTRSEVNIPVVKVLIPGAETWPTFHLHIGRASLGQRAMASLTRSILDSSKAKT